MLGLLWILIVLDHVAPEFWLNLQQARDLWGVLHGPEAADVADIERLEGVS